MRHNDKENLIRGLPVYAICLLMIAGVAVLYVKKPPKKAEPLKESITRYLENGKQTEYLTVDDVINDRRTWEPLLADFIGQPLEDFEFTDIDGNTRRLTDFAGGPLLVTLWATWSPGCTMQFGHWQELCKQNPGLVIIAFSSESEDALKNYAAQNQGTLMLVRQQQPLPKPLSDVSDIPAVFFIDRQGKLFLAAKGLIPLEQADAILKFMEPGRREIKPK